MFLGACARKKPRTETKPKIVVNIICIIISVNAFKTNVYITKPDIMDIKKILL